MTLGSVASCGLVTLSFPVLLLLAVLVFLGAFATHGDARYVLWFIAVAFVVAYFVSRQALLTISSSGGERIAVPARGVKRNDLIAFINEVEKAKLMYRG